MAVETLLLESDEGAPQRADRLSPARVCDIALSFAALVFFGPLMVLIATAIWMMDGGLPFYCQRRVGFGGRTFQCWKFRSMCVDSQDRLAALLATSRTAQIEWELEQKLKVDPRITRVGRFLRKTSLDELPQLWNVLQGEMSLVGPRPIVGAEIPRYGRQFGRYCQVRPGITGLWQVSGRSGVTYQRRVAMDVLYVRRQSFALYLKLLIATVPAVLMQKGAV